MTELAEPLPVDEPRAGLLARAVGLRLRLGWELAALASLVIVGAGFRFWDLGARALHHDESLHGFYSYALYRGDGYVHDPLMHGPFQFFGTAFTFVLAGGASDYAVRIFPALFGTILIVLPFFFRHRLGYLGALFASALIAFSPTLMYFSRFARNDIYIAVFTLGIVISLWRYLDDRKPLFLYIGAGLLGLSFATKENTFLHVAVLLTLLNFWLAADLARQSREKTGEGPAVLPFYTLLYLPWAWAMAAVWPVIGKLRESLGLRQLHPAAGFLVVLGTLSLPQFSAGIQVPLDSVFGVSLDTVDAERAWGIPVVVGLLAATAAVGMGWNWRVWPIAAAAFYIPYALLYTSFLTHIDGFGSGIWESLDYWLDQQDVRRGDQPWFYYLMLLPTYEILPLVIGAPALFYYALKGDVFRRFLVFWVFGTFVGYIWAAEKMPWLSVHTTLPVVILGAYVLGDIFSRLPKPDRLQPVAPRALPFAAAALGLAAAGFAAFGPAGDGWVALRVLLALAALAALAWLLRPFDRRRLAVGLTAAVVGALSLFTVRAGITATYEHGDVPHEMLVYTQTAPHVPDVMDRIEEAGRVSGLGKELPIFVDNTYAWPWHWYLRDYPRAIFGGTAGDFTPEQNAVVLIALENESVMQPYLDQYQEPVRHPLRWWFPEFDTYKTLPVGRAGVPDFIGEFIGSLFRASAWETWWRYFRDRDHPSEIGAANAIAYFPKAYPVEGAFPSEPAEPAAPTEPLAPPAVDAQGRFVLGQVGNQPGAFSDPTGLTVDGEGNIYVADTGNNRVQKFDANGAFIRSVGVRGAATGQFDQPADVAIDAEGNVYVADTWNHRIQKFDRDLNFLIAFGVPAADLDNPGRDHMWGPRAVDIDADGNVLVTDTGTGRVQKFSPSGEVLDAVGGRGGGAEQLSEPVGLAVGAGGDVWVADVGNARLQKLDSDLNFLAAYPLDPWASLDTTNKPYLAVLPDGRVLTSDGPGSRLLLVTGDGALAATLADVAGTAFTFPRGIAIDAGGFIYVTEPTTGQVLRFPISDLGAP